MKILSVIQARGGSKTIKKKNIVNLNDHPLISYTIYAALKCNLIHRLVVSTDDREIQKVAINYGAEAPFLRPKRLARDNTYSIDSLRYYVLQCEKFYNERYDYIIELPCVAPLRNSNHINEALNILLKNKNLDSVTSYVSTGEKHPIRLKRIKNNKVTSFCKDYQEPARGSRKQNFEPCYIRNGAIYAMTRDCLIKKKSRHGDKQFPYIMNEDVSVNIDYQFDLTIARLLIQNGHCENYPKIIDNFKPEILNIISNKIKILVTAPFDFLNEEKDLLKKYFNCDFIYGVDLNSVLKKADQYQGWLCAPSPKYVIDKKILRHFSNLKIIVTPSTGVNHINKKDCDNLNIALKSLKDTKITKSITASSEYTLTLLLSLIRKMNIAMTYPLQGRWREQESKLRSIELNGKTVGIIGFGRIGGNLAKYLHSMGMMVIFNDPNVFNFNKNYQKKTLSELVKLSDIIVLSAYLNDETKNLMNKTLFLKMKKKPFFINTSRGELVVEEDLLWALKKNLISGAALDVVSNEQTRNIKKSIFYEYLKNNGNLIITPHIAGLTIDSEKKAANASIAHLKKFFRL